VVMTVTGATVSVVPVLVGVAVVLLLVVPPPPPQAVIAAQASSAQDNKA
jgi:hypothetical protein